MATTAVQPEDEHCDCGHSHGHEHDDTSDTREHPPTSLAHQLWMPWRIIALNPIPTAVVYIVFNTVFMAIWLVVSLVIYLVTLPGLLLLLAATLFYGLRLVALYVSYPGQLSLVVRDGEANFAKLTKRRLTMALDASMELVQALGDREMSTLPHASHRRQRFLQRYENFTFTLETLVLPLLHALEQVDTNGLMGNNGAKLLAALQDLHKFQTQELSRYCEELTNASIKEFESRRQQLFLTPAVASAAVVGLASTPPSSTSSSSSRSKTVEPTQWMPGRLVAALEEKIHRIRELLSLVGPPAAVANAKKDLTWIARELCQRKSSTVDIITTLDLIRADLAVRFHGEQVWIPGHDNHQIDAMFLPAAGGFSVDKPVMILCNPNGGLYEFHHFQMDWIQFYTDAQCHVLLFNYRGYGRNTGVPSPWAHNLDALAIVDFLKTRKRITTIGVHGESIGGLVATYLACHSDAVSVLVADRTFANLPALAQRLVASWAGRAVTWLTWWETDNAGNFLAARCPKLLCSDPNDDIISDGASLKSGVALRVELGDETLDLPPPLALDDVDAAAAESDEATTAPPPIVASPAAVVLDSVPFVSKCVAFVMGERPRVQRRRRSDAETRPQPGLPLTDAIVRRFSEAALSLGRRAMQYVDRRDRTTSKSRGANSSSSSSSSSTHSSHVEISVHATTPRLAFPEELLAVVWMQLASLDGYCGQCFLQAAESGGFDRIRAWTASMLMWGGQLPPAQRTKFTLHAFDRQGLPIQPVTIHSVHSALQAIADQHPGAKFDLDLGVVLEMVDYLMDTLQRRWKLLDGNTLTAATNKKLDEKQLHTPAMASCTARPATVGRLLVLHCGHNRQFAESEKGELLDFLRSVNFVPTR